jgi:porin
MRTFYAALACGLASTVAHAQSTPGAATLSQGQSPETAKPADPDGAAEPTPTSAATPPLQARTPPAPSGPLSSVGTALSDRGIYLRAILVDEFAGNVTGGQGKGARNSFATAFGGDLDLDRLVGLKGGQFHITFNKSVGESLAAKDTLNSVSFQTRFKTFQNLRLAILAYDQSLFDGKVAISAGRVSALSYFNASPIYCNFQNNAVCFSPSVTAIGDKGLSFFPYGTWGGRLKIAPDKRFYIQAGVFEANLALQSGDGFDFSTRKATGVEIPIEIGLQSASPKAAHAYHLRIGGYVNTSTYPDPYLNTARLPLIPSGGKPLIHNGLHSWYVMGDVVLHRAAANPARNITLFGGTIATAENYVPWKGQTLVGAVVTGPFAARPADTFGVAASFFKLGRQQVRFLDAARRHAGGTDPAYPSEAIIEVNYGIALRHGIRLNPNIQYILHPDNNLRPASQRRSGNIVAFGARLSVQLGEVLGFPLTH